MAIYAEEPLRVPLDGKSDFEILLVTDEAVEIDASSVRLSGPFTAWCTGVIARKQTTPADGDELDVLAVRFEYPKLTLKGPPPPTMLDWLQIEGRTVEGRGFFARGLVLIEGVI